MKKQKTTPEKVKAELKTVMDFRRRYPAFGRQWRSTLILQPLHTAKGERVTMWIDSRCCDLNTEIRLHGRAVGIQIPTQMKKHLLKRWLEAASQMIAEAINEAGGWNEERFIDLSNDIDRLTEGLYYEQMVEENE